MNSSLADDCQSYGTKSAVAVAPVSLTAAETSLKTGRSRWVWPAFLGFVPPTTLVPEIVPVRIILFEGIERDRGATRDRTVFDGLTRVETASALGTNHSEH